MTTAVAHCDRCGQEVLTMGHQCPGPQGGPGVQLEPDTNLIVKFATSDPEGFARAFARALEQAGPQIQRAIQAEGQAVIGRAGRELDRRFRHAMATAGLVGYLVGALFGLVVGWWLWSVR